MTLNEFNLSCPYFWKSRTRYNNKFKPAILGDSQYYVKRFKYLMKRKGYNIYTDVNIRNAKDENKLEKIKKHYLKVSRNMATKEINFVWLYKYPKLN